MGELLLILNCPAGSSYSDEMMVDVALSKYCDLIPVERYVQMADRGGVSGLPANTLIQGTHNLADFLAPVYKKIRNEVMSSNVLHADETPHRMLEGDEKSQWYLWGFSNDGASYFEAHDTRSGSVPADIIKESECEFLVSDVFSGYSKAVTDSNVYRREQVQGGGELICERKCTTSLVLPKDLSSREIKRL